MVLNKKSVDLLTKSVLIKKIENEDFVIEFMLYGKVGKKLA